MVEVLVDPVRYRPVGEQGREALLACIYELLLAAYIEIGFLLARERRVGQVLGGG